VTTRRWRAVGGVVGPVAFVATWATLGAMRDNYSPVHDPISRLAAVGAPTRVAMTAAFLAFSAGVGAFAPLLRDRHGTSASRALAVNALATIGVAALPLEGFGGDKAHAVAAGVAYASLAAAPWFGGSKRTGAVIGAVLAASAVLPSHVGFAQRAGLTLGDAWIVATAIRMLRK
jgi:hypothetical protein